LAKILAIGIATLDIINTVQAYPDEDDEIRATSQRRTRGGNATNTLAVLSQLKHQCYWAGTLANEIDTKIILDDLDKYQIDYSYVDFLAQGKIPTSYITLSKQNGSRTIIHYRDLPEYSLNTFQNIPLSQFDWIHFEGRNISETRKMLQYCKQQYPHIPISLEIEKNRPQIDSLFGFCEVLMFSKNYAKSQGFDNANDFLIQLSSGFNSKILSCTWGVNGAELFANGQYYQSPSFSNEKAINTIAAGDTFNAGLIDNLNSHQNFQKCLNYACELAGKKCASERLDFLLQKT